MSPVFAHGQLRLYLLAVLADGPRHGYEIMRGLEDRFHGLYSPSAGTVYPRLAKLEEEGLVARTEDGRKSTYSLTEAGYAEVQARWDELGSLEDDLDRSVQDLAVQVRSRVKGNAQDLRTELRAAAKAARSEATPISATADYRLQTEQRVDVERLAAELRAYARRVVRDKRADEQVIEQVRRLLDDTLHQLQDLSPR